MKPIFISYSQQHRDLDRVLGLEYEHWDKTLNLGQRPNLSQAIRRGVAQLALIDGVDTRATGAALISGDPFYRLAADVNVPDVQRALGLLFPGADDGLSALEPDLIGEHHVAEVTDTALLDVSLAWAGDKNSKRRQILTVLQRTTRPEHGSMAGRATPLIDHVIGNHAKVLAADMVAVMTDIPGALLRRFELHLDVLDEETLEAVSDVLPLQSLELMEFSLRIAMRLADAARKTNAVKGALPDVPQRHTCPRLANPAS